MAKPLRGRLVYAYSFDLKMQIKAVHALFLFSLFLLLFSSNATQAQTSISNGSWNSAGTWSGNAVPSASDNVVINHIVTIPSGTTAEINNLTINADGKLIVYGTLIVNYDMTMNFQGNNESEFEMKPNSIVIVRGNVYLTTKVSLNLSSYFIVIGNLDAQSSSDKTDVNINDASIYVFGSVSDNIDLTVCNSYDGLTETNNETCHIGTDSAFFKNAEEDLIPDEIIEIVVTCNPTATISGDATICEGGFAPITVEFTGTGPWEITTQRNGGNDVTVNNIDVNPYIFEVSEAGVYTVSAVSDANCTGMATGSATVMVNRFNMVASDVTLTPSGEHCPEFGGPFNPDNSDYNAGVTEVIFKVIKEESTTGNWTFDFAIDETGDVEVYDLFSVTGNNSTITYNNAAAGGSFDATDNTEVIFTFQIKNVPGTSLDVEFTVSNGNDGICIESGSNDDNNITHIINVMPAVGSFSP